MLCEKLLSAAKAGDAEALGQLLEVYRGYLRLLAETQIRGKLQARFGTSDVLQDTFLSAHRCFGRFRGRSEPEFRGWLRKILICHIGRLVERHMAAGKRDVRHEISLQDIAAAVGRSTVRLESLLAGAGASPSREAVRNESVFLLAEHMQQLPDDYREVLLLRHLEGLPFADVAQRMGRSAGAVRMLWLRALELLRQRMGREAEV